MSADLKQNQLEHQRILWQAVVFLISFSDPRFSA
jgi:hypothetical protein